MLSKYFSYEEMIRSQTATRYGIDNTAGEGEVLFLEILCRSILDPVREQFGIPFSPSSGYRCKELNEKIGSKPTSQHVLGQAADIEIPGIANAQLAWWIRSHLDFDQLILEYYEEGDPRSGWVHVSTKGSSDSEGGGNRREVFTYNGAAYTKGLPG